MPGFTAFKGADYQNLLFVQIVHIIVKKNYTCKYLHPHNYEHKKMETLSGQTVNQISTLSWIKL